MKVFWIVFDLVFGCINLWLFATNGQWTGSLIAGVWLLSSAVTRLDNLGAS